MKNIRIKICGVTEPADATMCADYGADAIGINFHPGSPRYVNPQQSQPLLRAVHPLMSSVGVFVGLPMRQITAMAYQMGLRGVQYHGENRELADAFPFSLISAFRIRDQKSITAIHTYLEMTRSFGSPPGAILVDAYVEGQHGGTGQTAPWELLKNFKPGVPWILAGGLTPENVGEAVRLLKPDGVDVASGVESAPGKKDPAKVKAFIDNARQAAASC